jgi:Fic family protein
MRSNTRFTQIVGTPYEYDSRLEADLGALHERVRALRTVVEKLSPRSLERLQNYFRLKNIYNSNAIEGNTLTMGETRLVIEQGLTITGKPLKDTVEAKNLSNALDLFEELAKREGHPITVQDLLNIHSHILTGIDDRNAGKYRSVFIEISGSQYKPPDPAQIQPMMRDFGQWLESVSQVTSATTLIDPVVLACTAHAWFVYIHPFIDGNGRTSRLLMNLLLIRFGYPIAILTKDDRYRYYEALEESQGGGNLTPFIRLVMESVLEGMEIYEESEQQQLLLEETLVATDSYQVFASAMRLLQVTFKQVVAQMANQEVTFREFGVVEFERYQSLKYQTSEKWTWFLRLTHHDGRSYLFFFDHASSELQALTHNEHVSVHIAVETSPYHFERLSQHSMLATPDIIEISYLPKEERFVMVNRKGELTRLKAEEIATEFIKQAFQHLS